MTWKYLYLVNILNKSFHWSESDFLSNAKEDDLGEQHLIIAILQLLFVG